MGKDTKKKTEPEAVADGDEQSREEQAEAVVREAEMVRVEILVAVNGHVKHDRVTVASDNEFYSGLVDQKMAQVID